MRSILITGILAGLVHLASAQEIGIRAGVDLHKFHRITDEFWDESDKFTAGPGFGITFRMPFKERSAFRTGLFYSDVSNRTDVTDYSLSHRFLKMPLQYGFTVVREDVRSGFFFGPNLGYGLNAEYHIQDEPYDLFRDQAVLHKRFFFGLGAGIRAEYLGITLELQYNFDVLIPGDGFDSESSTVLGNEILSIWLGYSYSFAKKPHRYAGRK